MAPNRSPAAATIVGFVGLLPLFLMGEITGVRRALGPAVAAQRGGVGESDKGDGALSAPDVALQTWLARVGISPESMAAAGLTSAEATALVGAIKNHLVTNSSVLASGDAALDVAKKSADALARLVRTGLGTPADIAACAQAQQTLEAAHVARAAALDAMFVAGVQGLPAAKRTVLGNIRANGVWSLPAEYRVANRTEAQWIALRDAWAAKRTTVAIGGTLDPTSAAILATVDAEAAVSAAKASVQTSLGTIASAWNQAVAQ